jgi:hypothetical protein
MAYDKLVQTIGSRPVCDNSTTYCWNFTGQKLDLPHHTTVAVLVQKYYTSEQISHLEDGTYSRDVM